MIVNKCKCGNRNDLKLYGRNGYILFLCSDCVTKDDKFMDLSPYDGFKAMPTKKFHSCERCEKIISIHKYEYDEKTQKILCKECYDLAIRLRNKYMEMCKNEN